MDTGNASARFFQDFFEFRNVSSACSGCCIAAIGKRMHDKIADIRLFCGPTQRIEVGLLGVNPSLGNQSHEMQSDTRCAGYFERTLQRGFLLEGPICYSPINAQQVLVHDASRSNVHVPHFAVAHLSFWQAHMLTVRPQGGVGRVAKQTVHKRRVGCRDGIGVVIVSNAPTIKNDQGTSGRIGRVHGLNGMVVVTRQPPL